jgi:hypothetical protein
VHIGGNQRKSNDRDNIVMKLERLLKNPDDQMEAYSLEVRKTATADEVQTTILDKNVFIPVFQA